MKGWHRLIGHCLAPNTIRLGRCDTILQQRRGTNGLGEGRVRRYGPWAMLVLGHVLGVWILVTSQVSMPSSVQQPRSAQRNRSGPVIPVGVRLEERNGAKRKGASRFTHGNVSQTVGMAKGQRTLHDAFQRTLPSDFGVQATPRLDDSRLLEPSQRQRFEQQRSRLQAELTEQGQTWLTGLVLQPSDASAVATTRDVVERLHALATLEWQVQAEVWAAQQWQQAIDFASQASTLGNLSHPTLATWYQAKHYWQMALDHLRRIPAVSSRRPQVISKYREYRHNLDVARYRSELLQSAFLRTIAAQAQLSPQTRMTVCRGVGECRHYGGNAIVESPASLIKIPVAIAVLHQLQQGRVSLGTAITVTPGNYTEDLAEIQVGKTYPLRVLLSQMLSHSSNIATNQLIDYFGWDTLNQSLQQAGYRFSRVHFKLMGQTQMPANPGSRANTLNSDELSRMMRQIYLGHSPGHRVVQQALANQQDRDLGIRALAHHSALWVGEKTGRTSSTLGTTVALKIRGDLYIITIVDQTGKGERELRQGIQAITTYLEQDPAMRMPPAAS